jgi:hypothetical protein
MQLCCASLAGILLISISAAQDGSGTPPASAVARMSEAGAQQKALAARIGTWEVVATLWPKPGAAPVVTQGLIAERTMVGPFLQEIMRPAPHSAVPDFRRIDYLTFDRVEGRWKYVSMDTRFPVSIMPAWGLGGQVGSRDVTVYFEPQAFVGFGTEVEGRFMVSDMLISQLSPERELKVQHVTMADGSGTQWKLVTYEYTRRVASRPSGEPR